MGRRKKGDDGNVIPLTAAKKKAPARELHPWEQGAFVDELIYCRRCRRNCFAYYKRHCLILTDDDFGSRKECPFFKTADRVHDERYEVFRRLAEKKRFDLIDRSLDVIGEKEAGEYLDRLLKGKTAEEYDRLMLDGEELTVDAIPEGLWDDGNGWDDE